jgi:hypothetical protein
MRRFAFFAGSVLALALAVRPAAAAYFTGCCACGGFPVAMTAEPPPSPAIQALFCTLVVGEGAPEFVARCEDAGGSDIKCTYPAPGESCSQALASIGIACPAEAGVPTASPWNLAALVVALSGFGALVLRRHAR